MAETWQFMDSKATARRRAALEFCLGGHRGDRYGTAWRLHLLILVAEQFDHVMHPKGERSTQAMIDAMNKQLELLATTNKNEFGEVVTQGPVIDVLSSKASERDVALRYIQRELKPLFLRCR